MTLLEEISVNQWGQKLIPIENIEQYFLTLNYGEKKKFVIDLSNLIIQSKPEDFDIDESIIKSELRHSYTPCILLKKNGLKTFSFEKIANLPENELSKSLKLFLYLFQISYYRRFEKEKNDINKWWYWDLSDDKNIELLLKNKS